MAARALPCPAPSSSVPCPCRRRAALPARRFPDRPLRRRRLRRDSASYARRLHRQGRSVRRADRALLGRRAGAAGGRAVPSSAPAATPAARHAMRDGRHRLHRDVGALFRRAWLRADFAGRAATVLRRRVAGGGAVQRASIKKPRTRHRFREQDPVSTARACRLRRAPVVLEIRAALVSTQTPVHRGAAAVRTGPSAAVLPRIGLLPMALAARRSAPVRNRCTAGHPTTC